MTEPDPKDDFKHAPQFEEILKTALIGVILTSLCLIAYFGFAVYHH